MVIVADGTDDAAERLERVLTSDPGTGVIRHARRGLRGGARGRARAGASASGPGGVGLSLAPGRAPPGRPRQAHVAWNPYPLRLRPRAEPARPRPGPGRFAGGRGRAAARARPRALDVVEDAYVLCRDGRIAEVGRDARPGGAPRRGGGRAGRPGPVRRARPRRLPHAPLLRRRPGRRVRAAVGRRDLRGAPRCRRRDPVDRPGDAGCRRRTGCGRAVERHRAMDARPRDDHLRGEVRLRARSRDRARSARGRSRRAAASRPGSGRTPFLPSSRTPTPTWTSRSRRCSPRRRESPRPPTSSSSVGAFDVRPGPTVPRGVSRRAD